MATQQASQPQPQNQPQALAEMREQLRAQEERIEELTAALNHLVDLNGQAMSVERGSRSGASIGASDLLAQQSLVGVLASAVEQLQVLRLERRVAMREGDRASLQAIDLRAAGLACGTMDEVIDNLRLPRDLDDVMPANVDDFLQDRSCLLRRVLRPSARPWRSS
jgi:hypothetical protein